MKVVEFTGSPKSAGFKTKATFLAALEEFGFVKGKMKKRGNEVSILVTDDLNSTTSKMKLAAELGVDIMSYEELVETFELEGDL
jgi:hypothetical protein